MDWFTEGPISEAAAATLLVVIFLTIFALIFFVLFPSKNKK